MESLPKVSSGTPMPTQKPLLVLSTQAHLPPDQLGRLREYGQTLAESVGMTLAVMSGGIKTEVHHDIGSLVEAIKLQTQAITALAESNMMLVEAMGQEDGGDPDAPPAYYMDGTPVRG